MQQLSGQATPLQLGGMKLGLLGTPNTGKQWCVSSWVSTAWAELCIYFTRKASQILQSTFVHSDRSLV